MFIIVEFDIWKLFFVQVNVKFLIPVEFEVIVKLVQLPWDDHCSFINISDESFKLGYKL